VTSKRGWYSQERRRTVTWYFQVWVSSKNRWSVNRHSIQTRDSRDLFRNSIKFLITLQEKETRISYANKVARLLLWSLSSFKLLPLQLINSNLLWVHEKNIHFSPRIPSCVSRVESQFFL
jgi:hypothetical protein